MRISDWSSDVCSSDLYEWDLSNSLQGRFNIGAKYMSDYNTGSDLDVEKHQDAYTVVNARVGIGASDNRWSLELWGTNITDTEYVQGGSTGRCRTSRRCRVIRSIPSTRSRACRGCTASRCASGTEPRVPRGPQCGPRSRPRGGRMGYNVRFRRSACMSDPIPTDAELRSIVDAVGTRLRESRDLLVTAESCTGGWIAKTATDIRSEENTYELQ